MSGADKVIPVKVALRIRPLVSKERADACTECLRTTKNEPQVILGKDKCFTYDYVFSQSTPQIDVYEQAVQPLLNSLFKGYNATVLAYGQTGSGKTYTMGSGYQSLQSALSETGTLTNQQLNINDLDDVGIIPRVLSDLFARIEDDQRQRGTKYTVKVSLIEVYNEEIKDLFAASSKSSTQEPLNIREENNTIRVVNLSEIQVNNALNTIQLLEKGSSMRVVGGTAMNDQSSRSHAIFTISLEQIQQATNGGADENAAVPTNGGSSQSIIKSKFHLVDLAGSERQSKTKAEGLRLKEGININLGLLALGNVISVLGEESSTIKHVPYRESKLTRLLQDSLGGNSHTVMIACVSPADYNMEETLNTLRYADRARKIKNKPVVNVDPQAAELVLLRQQVQQLKAQVYQLTGGSGETRETFSNDLDVLKEENEKLKIENIKLINELNRLVNSNKITYNKMMKIETEKEELAKKFDELKAMVKKLSRECSDQDTTTLSNLTNVMNGDVTMNITSSQKSMLSEIEAKIGELEAQQTKAQQQQQQQAENDEADQEQQQQQQNPLEPAEKDYALRQAQMQVQLTEYDSELAKKESLFKKMMENQTYSGMFGGYESATSSGVDELKSKIAALEKEKEELQDMLRSSDSASRKIAEQKRDRLKQLEADVLELRKKERELVKMIKLKEENEKHCEKLRNEIQTIKCERVKLLKQMRADTDSFRKYKQEKEKEVNHLKAMERKRMVEITKLQEGSHKQEAVLRRKNDEITRIQRQLRETLEKQKLVAEKRQLTFDRKDSSTTADKLRQWITQELELSVNIAEARLNLNKLTEERKESAAELARLEDKLASMADDSDMSIEAPAAKRNRLYSRATDGSENESESAPETRSQLKVRVERLREDIECKSIQINDIQQMVLEGDQDEKAKHMFNNIHGLLEAKVLLKHLYNTGVQYLLDSKLKQVQFETNSNSLTQELKDLKKRYEAIEDELANSKKRLSKEMSDLTQYYEQRVLYELKTALSDPSCSVDERFVLLKERIQTLERKLDSKPGGVNSGLFNRPLTTHLSASASSKLGGDGDDALMPPPADYKRAQKLKKEHRKTRVIRIQPGEGSLLNITNNIETPSTVGGDGAQFLSPYSQTMRELELIATPDDNKQIDPDWANTPVGGAVGLNKRRSRAQISKKPTLRKIKSKSNFELPVIEANENENEEIVNN